MGHNDGGEEVDYSDLFGSDEEDSGVCDDGTISGGSGTVWMDEDASGNGHRGAHKDVFSMSAERARIAKQYRNLFTVSAAFPALNISCEQLDADSRTHFEIVFEYYCAYQHQPRKHTNTIQMEAFANAVVDMLVRLGLHVAVDWEAVYCYISISELLLVIYYWKMALLAYLPRINANEDKMHIKNALVQTSVRDVREFCEVMHMFVPILQTAAAKSSASCIAFLNSFLKVARSRLPYLAATAHT
jgi:hypothetical protein